MSNKKEQFIRKMTDALPGLSTIWEKSAKIGQPGSNVYIRDLAVFYRAAREPDTASAYSEALSYLDHAYGSDPEVDELIEENFLSFLPEPGYEGAEFLELLPPKLEAARHRLFENDPTHPPRESLDFIQRMLHAAPWLQEVMREHTDDYTSRLLDHIFLADVTRETAELYEREGLAHSTVPEPVRQVLDFLESEFHASHINAPLFDSESYVDNMIAVSFIENLPERTRPGYHLIGVLPPKLRAEYDRQMDWSPYDG